MMHMWFSRGMESIDLVYCWCDGTDFEKLDKCRFSNNGELYYSIKSVDRYAPWFRTIWIFANDGTDIPDWLSSHPKVKVVFHHEIIPVKYLPLNNSVSIEFWLAEIPGLAERFVYANDDMFLARRVTPGVFFTGNGRMICRYKSQVMGEGGVYWSELAYSRAFMEKQSEGMSLTWRRALNHPPHHNMDGYLKSVIKEFCDRFPEEVDRAGRAKNRIPDQLIRDVFSLWAMATRRGVFRFSASRYRLHRVESFELGIQYRQDYRYIHEKKPYIFCLNDNEGATDADREYARNWLEEWSKTL